MFKLCEDFQNFRWNLEDLSVNLLLKLNEKPDWAKVIGLLRTIIRNPLKWAPNGL